MELVLLNNSRRRDHESLFGNGAFYDLDVIGGQSKYLTEISYGQICVVAHFKDIRTKNVVVFSWYKFESIKYLIDDKNTKVRAFFGILLYEDEYYYHGLNEHIIYGELFNKNSVFKQVSVKTSHINIQDLPDPIKQDLIGQDREHIIKKKIQLSSSPSKNKKLLQPVIVDLLSQYGFSEAMYGFNGDLNCHHVISEKFGFVHITNTLSAEKINGYDVAGYIRASLVDHYALSFIDINSNTVETYVLTSIACQELAREHGASLPKIAVSEKSLVNFLSDLSKYSLEKTTRPNKKPSTSRKSNTHITSEEYLEIYKENHRKGEIGEQFILEVERNFLISQGREDLAKKVEHTALTASSAGYDIKSYFVNGHPKYIEVKTTSGNQNTPFFLSKNELATSKKLSGSYYIYRVYMVESEKEKSFFIIEGDLQVELNLEPALFSATFQ
ncbi:DUF3883 domain-containing protein [Alteromonas ponticola]|uniref:DUF3883 domain-containing protein n=1 Tax=Alteromonas aquimaris TaxID=2998417 RepID=A0ABT3P830_9ALTE|nr:DUF3883 domain-containing protein [Alteromonas aquimaris]MCW8108899.1 DUF3883 domain-containing protein [Alteromonas aquimaris]